MYLYVLRRALYGVLVLLLVSIIVFIMFFVAPGDPARAIAGPQASPEVLAQITDHLGLNRPLPVQYLSFLGNALHGDLGFSYRNQSPVTGIVLSRIPVTASLVFGAMVLWLLVGIGTGVAAGRRPGSVRDRVISSLSMISLSFPTFVLGMALLFVFYYLPARSGFLVFPPGGYVAFGDDPLLWAHHLALPWCVLALVTFPIYTRLTRSQLIDAMSEDYVRTARSKGMRENRVVYFHALRNVAPSIFIQLGVDIGAMLGGVVLTEQVFGLPGLGSLAVQSVFVQDRPVVIGVVLFATTCIVAINLLVDIGYTVLEPRSRKAIR